MYSVYSLPSIVVHLIHIYNPERHIFRHLNIYRVLYLHMIRFCIYIRMVYIVCTQS